MKEPLISVIVAIYKVEKYLDKCLESIVNQTYENLEIILVDDGSPDNCPAICDEWAKKDSRIKVIHKQNGGVSSAKNTGLENANGDYINFVDGDDMIVQDMYEILVSDSVENDTDISMCTFNYMDDDFNEISYSNPEYPEKATYYSPDEICALFFEKCNGDFVSLCNKIIKRELFNGFRFPDGRVFEDWTLAPMLYSRSRKTSHLPLKKYTYVIHSGSIVRTETLKRYADCVMADIDHYNYFKDMYREKIIDFIGCDFFKCCKTYRVNRNDRKTIRNVYRSCRKVCNSRKITVYYHLRFIISVLYRVKQRIR